MLAWLRWWGVITLLGWATWPMTRPIFQRVPGQGWAYARAIGLIVVNYGFWLLGMSGLIPNSTACLWLVVGTWTLICLLCAARQRRKLWPWLRHHWRHIATVELLFAVVMVLYALHKAYDPAINHTEEPMDLLFINGILASPALPPRDPWLSGFSISYYYLGYLIVASLARLTRVPAGVGYNLGLAHTLALFTVGLYGVLYALIPPSRYRGGKAVLGAILVAFVGNLETLAEMLSAWGLGSAGFYRWLAIPSLGASSETPSIGPQGSWWWWRASRVIQDTNLLGRNPTVITEFPAFSFVLGDLHPHVMALPYVTVVIGLLPSLYRYGRHPENRPPARAALLLPLIVGALGFLNSWDLPTFLGLCILSYAAGRWRRDDVAKRWLIDVGIAGGYLAAVSLLLYLPFYRGLQTQAQGLGLVYYAKTSLLEYLLCFGGFYLPILGGVLCPWVGAWRDDGASSRGVWFVWLGLLAAPWALTLLLGGWGRTLIGLFTWLQAGPWVLLLQSGMLSLLAVRTWRLLRRRDVQGGYRQLVSPLLAIAGLSLTYIVEFFYLRDVFDTRMNTVFKFSYQAWALLGISAVLSLGALWRAGRGWLLLGVVSAALLVFCLYYPLAASYTRAEGYSGAPTLDGTAYLQDEAPQAKRLSAWIEEHATPHDVLVEAPGEEYDASTSRFSTLTGIPTILGWPGHEVQWRGDDAIVLERLADLETIYTSGDSERALTLLHSYGATWLVLDPYAVSRYDLSAAQIAALDAILPLHHVEGNYRLYAVPSPTADAP